MRLLAARLLFQRLLFKPMLFKPMLLNKPRPLLKALLHLFKILSALGFA